MNNITKISLFIVLPVIVIAVGAFTFSQINSSQNQPETQGTAGDSTEEVVVQTPSEASTVLGKPTTENPPDQGDVGAQPAYLVSAYTRHEKDYIGVDYVMVFEGAEAVDAMVEDGVCTDEATCQVDPEGYIRNKNPHFRTYEISTTTPLVVDVSGVTRDKALEMGLDASNLTFENLKEVVPELPQYVPSKEFFKEAKSFVYIDVIGGGITKIREP